MSTVYAMTYKLDMTMVSDGPKKGGKNSKKNPIGISKEVRGTAEEIKKRICHEIDTNSMLLEDLYYGDE